MKQILKIRLRPQMLHKNRAALKNLHIQKHEHADFGKANKCKVNL